MTEKSIIHGPGLYLLTLHGVKDQPIFGSVFDYEYGIRILSHIRGGRLVGYVLSPNNIHCLIRCQRDWTMVVDDIQAAFTAHYERCWHQSRNIISDECNVIFVDEPRYLVPVLLAMHRLPVSEKWIVDAAVYPWSSDHFYRSDNPPAWLDTASVLNRLCHIHHNQASRYAAAMEAPLTVKLDLINGIHPQYKAISNREIITPEEDTIPIPLRSGISHSLEHLFNDACELISHQFEIETESWISADKRRHYNQLAPLAAWLLWLKKVAVTDIARLMQQTDDQINCWLRIIDTQHSLKLLDKLRHRWGVGNHQMSIPLLTKAINNEIHEGTDNEDAGHPVLDNQPQSEVNSE